jgi:monothiol glutaredoxin
MGIEQFIDNEVKGNDVVLFMKGTPQFPQCGFSGQVVQILDHLGVAYKGLNVLDSADLRDGIKAYSNWPTIPQLYVKGEFVGGADIAEIWRPGDSGTAISRISAPQTTKGDMVAAIEEIIGMIEDGRPGTSTGADGRRTLSILLGILQSSAAGGKRIDFPVADV